MRRKGPVPSPGPVVSRGVIEKTAKLPFERAAGEAVSSEVTTSNSDKCSLEGWAFSQINTQFS